MPTPYDMLRQAHRDALDQHMAQQNPQPDNQVSSVEREPTRPENHPSQSQTPGWSADQRMDQQNASANRWAEASSSKMEAQRDLAQHEPGQQAPEAGRGTDEHGAARNALNSHETGDRSQKPTERDMMDARMAMTAEHEAARKGNGIEI